MNLSPLSNPLSNETLPDEVAVALETSSQRLGLFAGRVRYFSSVTSTNDVAASIAAGLDAEGVAVVADRQVAGRGRLGRTWFSPPGSGLYVSVVLTPMRARFEAARATTLLTLTAGVAMSEAVQAATGLGPDLKWPNDVYVGRRKLGGILAEAVTLAPPASRDDLNSGMSTIVLGYGINVGRAAYPPDLGDRATSLESELGRPVDRVLLLVETLAMLARRYDDLLCGKYEAILEAWRGRAPSSVGARVAWTTPSGRGSGITAGIDDNGALLVRTGEGMERIVAGELSWS